MSQELEECKAQLRATVAGMEESKKASSGNICRDRKECNDMSQLVFSLHANLTIDSIDNLGGNPEIVPGHEQHAQRKLEASERMLIRVIREKNEL